MLADRCPGCGAKVTVHSGTSHLPLCRFRRREKGWEEDVAEHVTAHVNKNGFLQLDLRPHCLARTKRELVALLGSAYQPSEEA